MAESIVLKLLESIPENDPISVHQLTHRSGIHYRTIKKYLQLIADIQCSKKVVKEQVGLRVYVKKERLLPSEHTPV